MTDEDLLVSLNDAIKLNSFFFFCLLLLIKFDSVGRQFSDNKAVPSMGVTNLESR